MRYVKTIFVFGLAYLVILSSNIRAVEITVSDTTINIPSPPQFAEISSLNPETFQMFQDLCPPSNRLLAVFVSESDAGRLMRGEPGIFEKYMMVQSSKEYETLSWAKHQFKELRRSMRDQYDSFFQENRDLINEMLESSGDVLSKSFDTEVVLKMGGLVPLGIDSETTSSITMSLLAKYNVAAAGESSESVVAGTTSIALVGGKVLYLYVYKTYQNDADLAWVRKTAQDWVRQALAANETVWPLATGSIVPVGTVVNPVTKELLAGEMSAYNLKSHPKAQGLNITIEYPKSWRSEEGIRPHIVWKFTGDSVGGTIPGCMIIVQELPAVFNVLPNESITEEISPEDYRALLPPNAVYIDGGKTKIDGELSVWVKFLYEADRAGVRACLYSLQYILISGGKMLVIQCSVSGLANDKELVEDAFLSYLPVFQLIGNSVVIHDKWENNSDTSFSHLMNTLFGRYWLILLILSGFLTFGMGFLLPSIIRYVALRHPMTRRSAIVYAINFVFFNLILSVFIRSGRPFELFAIVFLFSWIPYCILRRGSDKYEQEWLRRKRQSSTDVTSDQTTVQQCSLGQILRAEIEKPTQSEVTNPDERHTLTERRRSKEPEGDEKYMPPEMRELLERREVRASMQQPLATPPPFPQEIPSETTPPFEPQPLPADSRNTIYQANNQTPSAPPSGPKGVGGWLVFFCAGLTILGPLVYLGQVTMNLEEAEPAFAQFPSLRNAVYFESLGLALILLYGFVVGCMIWGGNPDGKKLAKQYLLIRLFGFIVIEFIMLLLVTSLPPLMVSAMFQGIVGAVFREGIVFLIWWLYFKKSKRIRNTYGEN